MTYLPVCECSDDVGCATAEHILQDEGLWIPCFQMRTLIYHSANIPLAPAISPLEGDITLLFVEYPRILWPTGEDDHRAYTEKNSRDAFNDEQEFPIRQSSVCMLDTKCDESTESAGDC